MHVPKYRKHPNRDYAFVEHRGKRTRLPGKHDSPESLDAYRHFVSQLIKQAVSPTLERRPGEKLLVQEVVASYLDFAKEYYPGERGEYDNCRHAFRPLLLAFGQFYAETFGPLKLKELQQRMIDGGSSRTYINQCVGKIKRVFRWAVSEELIPVEVYQAIATVPGLRMGRTKAKERRRKRPVSQADFDEVVADVGPVVAVMLQVQWLTGARSSSICLATPSQFARGSDVWLWRPRHKNEWRDQEAILPIGPKCQILLTPFLDRPATVPLFSPQEARRNKRYRARYTANSYRNAVQRAIKRINAARIKAGLEAGIALEDIETMPHWSPHSLRHSKGHATRSKHGLEAAQAVLGHGSIDATELYSDKRLELAIAVAREEG